MINLKDRLSELDVLLNYIDSEDWVKIPDNIIFYIKENKNKEYDWEYDETKSLEEQNLNKDTFSLLTFIMYKYIASEEEKKEINLLVNESTEELKQKYDVNNIFKKNTEEKQEISNSQENSSISEQTALVKIDEKKENLFSILISFFKRIFKKQ